MVKESETVQVGLRIERELLESIEFFAKNNKIDKMSMMKEAIASYVSEMEDAFEDAAVEDFIALRIDEETLKKAIGVKQIPKDIKDARQDVLKSITKDSLKR